MPFYCSLLRKEVSEFPLILQEVVADTLEQLWISYNKIERLTGIRYMKALKVFEFFTARSNFTFQAQIYIR